MVVFNGSNSLFRVNGGTNTPIAGTLGNYEVTSLELGGQMITNALGNVLLGEVIIYEGDQGSANGTNIFNYLGQSLEHPALRHPRRFLL